MTSKLRTGAQLEELRRSLVEARKAETLRICVCVGTGCLAAGSKDVLDAFREAISNSKIPASMELIGSGCRGLCEKGPLLVIYPQGTCYVKVTTEDVQEIVERSLIGGEVIERLLYEDPLSGERAVTEAEIPFYQKQRRIVLEESGKIDPKSIEDYIRTGGYAALSRVLSGMAPEKIIDEVVKSGLRGRGGGGFPTGRKWRSCRQAHGQPKYVICNADEGDPGAFMDRSILEGNPHLVLEGMAIGAYAIGAHRGFIYVRNEYPLAMENTLVAVGEAERLGLLGKDILGSGFDFEVEVAAGGGAFVCGESTALMASIEGKPGEPRAKDIHTTEKGLWDLPSNLNNVETWANVPLIIMRGADWFSSMGTEKSKGTKVFSLVGKVRNTGLIEVPMGITLREIIFDIGGGMPGGKRFKAVQTGGPSGGCIPEKYLDLPVDYERLTEVGSMMGSGSMIVMDEDTCMVDVARFFTAFLQEESCGKCTPCREGLRQMGKILDRVSCGEALEKDLDLLEELGDVVTTASLCGLGKTAANPVLTSLRYFRDEFEVHVQEKRCPARVCRRLLVYSIDPEKCTGCTLCAKACPVKCIRGAPKKVHAIDEALCTKCGVCRSTCKFDAVNAR